MGPHLRASSRLTLTLLLAGCGSDPLPPSAADASLDASPDAAADVPLPPEDVGPSCTVSLWDPTSQALDNFPDPRLVLPDPSTPTGFRLRVDPARFATTLMVARGFASLLTDLDTLDGFGVNAQAFFRFGRAFDPARLPTPAATRTPAGGLGFVVLSPGPARLVGALVSTTDQGATLMLAPLRPLPARARVAAYATRRLAPAAEGCLQAAPALTADLAAPTSETRAALDALRGLGVIEGVGDLVALTVYPTQSVAPESVAVAADITIRPLPGALARPTCVPDPMGRYRTCSSSFVAHNYLDGMRHLAPRGAGGALAAPTPYTLPVTVWLPATPSTTPLRTIVFGHGLGGDRGQAARLAAFAAPMGIATVAIDAAVHGDHPLNPMPGTSTLATVLNFFTLVPGASRAIDALALRDHFRQSTFDTLQLVRRIQAGFDADADGTPDLDPTRLAYLGVSLGGIMGAAPLALTDAFGAGVLVVPGGRVSAIISDSATFAPLITALRPSGTTPGDVARTFPLLQTLLERGDAASYGPHVFADRLTPGGSTRVPSVLVGVVLDDDTVPNVANYTLARALGVEVVGPLLGPAPGIGVVGPGPLAGNFGAGRATGGMLQFDVVGAEMGRTTRATHSNVGASDVGAEAWLHFLRTHWDTGLAEIADPYARLGIAHAP